MSARRIANWAIRSARGRSWRSGLSRRRASSPKSPLSTVRAELVEAPSLSAAQRRTALRQAPGKREQGFLRSNNDNSPSPPASPPSSPTPFASDRPRFRTRPRHSRRPFPPPLSTVLAELVEAPSFAAAQRRTALRQAQGKREQGFLRFNNDTSASPPASAPSSQTPCASDRPTCRHRRRQSGRSSPPPIPRS